MSDRAEIQAKIAEAVQSATERLPCGHWKGDRVGAGLSIAEPAYCRACAEISERTAAAMAAQRDAAITVIDASRDKVGRLMHESWTRTKRAQGFHHPDEMGHTGRNCCEKCHIDLVDWDALPQKQKDINCRAFDDVLPVLQNAIRNAPLASAPEQKWLEEHDAHRLAMLHSAEKKYIELAVQIRAMDKDLTRQLAVARAEAYKDANAVIDHFSANMPVSDFGALILMCQVEIERKAAEAKATAREGEVK